MGISQLEERGRVVIPKNMREELSLKPGQKVIVERREGGIFIKPAIDTKRFSSELRGCVKGSKIDPMEIKKIWQM